MNRLKYKLSRIIHMIVWSVIILLSFIVLIELILVVRIGDIDSSQSKKHSSMIATLCNEMIRSNLPIIKYVSDREDEKYFILNNMAGMFPINQYAVDSNEIRNDNYIKYRDDNLYILQSIDNRFNHYYYISMIYMGIQNTNHSSEDYQYNLEPIYYMENFSNYWTNRRSGIALAPNNLSGIIPIDIINGEIYIEYDHHASDIDNNGAKETLGNINGEYFTLDQLLNKQFLYNNFYIVDGSTSIDDSVFDAKYMIEKDFSIKKDNKPQILVYHTHSQEAFVDSREGVEAESIVGVGSYLTTILKEKYGFNVIHDKSKYDLMEGYIERNLAYNHAGDGIEKILKENPSIEVLIDVHRDGNDSKVKRVTKIDGKNTAQIMLLNGLMRNKKGKIEYLTNPYLKDNLAFSLQLQLKGREKYPGLMYKNYLHQYRYNLHYRPRTILAEVGTNWNTLEEAMNAMDYLAEILYDILIDG